MANMICSARPTAQTSPAIAQNDRFAVLEVLRRAAPLIGLKAAVLTTLETLVSCLPPKRGHNVVFASNATLVLRRHGISDRTLRRHIAALEGRGLLARIDSANGKRFTRYNPETDCMMRFGFDLSPLYHRLDELHEIAQSAEALRAELSYLKTKLRALIQQRLVQDPEEASSLLYLKALRRKLDTEALKAMIAHLSDAACENMETLEMTTSDRQIVRHYQNANKELNDKNLEPTKDEVLSFAQENQALLEFEEKPVQSYSDLKAYLQRLAPMIGVQPATYRQMQESHGTWVAIQALGRTFKRISSLRNPAGYFTQVCRRLLSVTGYLSKTEYRRPSASLAL